MACWTISRDMRSQDYSVANWIVRGRMRRIAPKPRSMIGQYKAQQPEKKVVEHLIDGRPFLQDVMADEKTQHEGEPGIHGKAFVPVAEESEAKSDFDVRNELKIGVNEKFRKSNAQISLEQHGVVLKKAAVAEELAGACGEKNRHHDDPNDALRIFQN